MVEIPLAGGHVALVDESDVALVRPFRWVVLKSPSTNVTILYARSRVERGSEQRQLMHHLVTGWPLVDHINGNGLDNRRANLREATRSQNGGNRLKRMAASSRYKGVSRYSQDHTRWKASIAVEGRKMHLGIFTDELNAAYAYDMAARFHFGEFAALNFPEPGERGALAA